MSIACRIQTHPRRAQLADALASNLDGFDDLQIIADPEPTAFANAWRSYQACLQTLGGADHILVIQDDATACLHLAETVRRIVRRHPDRIICLFVAGAPTFCSQAVIQAGNRGDLYTELPNRDWLPCVATIYPAEHAQGILDYVGSRPWRHGQLGDDHRLGEYLRHTQTIPLATVPNLVQHPDNVPSIMGTHALAGLNPARVSCCFIGDHDPLELDW